MRTVLQTVRRIANEILGVKELICLLFYLISLKFCGSSLIEGNLIFHVATRTTQTKFMLPITHTGVFAKRSAIALASEDSLSKSLLSSSKFSMNFNIAGVT